MGRKALTLAMGLLAASAMLAIAPMAVASHDCHPDVGCFANDPTDNCSDWVNTLRPDCAVDHALWDAYVVSQCIEEIIGMEPCL